MKQERISQETRSGWTTGQFDRGELIRAAMVDDATVHLVVDLALRIGEAQLACGAGAADVTATMLGVAEAYGLSQCEVDVIFTSITVCCRRGVEASPVTTTRVVRFRSSEYTRLAALDQLVLQILRSELTADEAYRKLEAVLSSTHAYPRWVATVGWAGMAASLAVMIGISMGFFDRDFEFFGAGFGLAVVAAAVTALVDRIGRVLNRRSLPYFFQQVVGAGVVTTVTMGLYGVLPGEVSPALVLAAGLTVLLSGLAVVGAAQDAITGFYVTAAGRAFEVALMTTGLVVGVVQVCSAAGLPAPRDLVAGLVGRRVRAGHRAVTWRIPCRACGMRKQAAARTRPAWRVRSPGWSVRWRPAARPSPRWRGS